MTIKSAAARAALLLSLSLATLIAPGVFATTITELEEDFDGDGIINRFDNCYLYANPSQADADSDGFGNACDTDLNNDLIVDFRDLTLLRDVFFTNDPLADFNDDGIVNFLDLSIFRSLFNNGRPGPAIIVRWNTGSGSWNEPTNWFPPEVPSLNFTHTEILNTDAVVLIEEGATGNAKTLINRGTINICGSLTLLKDFRSAGALNVNCQLSEVSANQGIELGGTITINNGRVETNGFRALPDTEPLVRFLGPERTELDALPFGEPLFMGVDVTFEPGADVVFGVSELEMDNATLTIRSSSDDATLLQPGITSFLGTGNIVFQSDKGSENPGQIWSEHVTFGESITVTVAPGQSGYLNASMTNFGTLTVSDDATLFIQKFSVLTNNSQIACSDGGRLREFDAFFEDPGDSILINNATGSYTAENCSTSWPTRVLNQGLFSVTRSDVVFPFIGAGGQPLSISQSHITVDELIRPLPADFYLFAPELDNAVTHQGLLDLGDQTLVIDAAKWRFAPADFNSASLFQFGTVVSATPFTVNENARVIFLIADIQADINIETGAVLEARDFVTLSGDINFVASSSCLDPTTPPATLRYTRGPLAGSTATQITADGTASGGAQCVRAAIDFANGGLLNFTSDINLTDASLSAFITDDGLVTLDSAIIATGSSELSLQGISLAGSLSCLDSASVRLSGSELRPFTHSGSMSGSHCALSFSDYWQNNSDVFLSDSTLSLAGPEAGILDFGSGNFITSLTDIIFDLAIDDVSALSAFKTIPPGGSFTFGGTIANVGPELNLSDLPFNTQFADGLMLSNTRITGSQPLRISGSAVLEAIELATPAEVGPGASLTLQSAFTLDNADVLIRASADAANPTTSVLLEGIDTLSGTGRLLLEANGTDALSQFIQTQAKNQTLIPATLGIECSGGGRCLVSAGDGVLDVAGSTLTSGSGTRLEWGSDVTLAGLNAVGAESQMLIADRTLTLAGPLSELVVELSNSQGAAPYVQAEGTAVLNIAEGALSLTATPDYVLPADATVTLLSHPAPATRAGEFADVSGAQIDGQSFTPDYSSSDETVLRGPTSPTTERAY